MLIWYLLTIRTLFQLIIEAFTGVGDGLTGHIEVDDVTITSGSCPEPINCNFDDGLCLWSQDKFGDTLDWAVVSHHGGLHDHTEGVFRYTTTGDGGQNNGNII